MQTISRNTDLSTARRAMVTVGAVVLLFAGYRIMLPGVDPDAGRSFAARFGVSSIFSIFSIGVMPIVSAAFVLEVAKLTVGRLRVWEAASPRNATLLQRVWFVLSLLIAAAQAYGMAGAMLEIGGVVPDPQGFAPIAIATLMGATALLFWLCLIVTRYGLVDGMWLLLAVHMLFGTPDLALGARTMFAFGAPELQAAALFVGALLIVTALLAVAGARVAVEGEPDRVGALVWPIIVGYYSATLANAAFLVAGSALLSGRAPQLAMFAALAFLIALMRSPAAEAGASTQARIVLVALQAATVIGGSLVRASVALPFVLNPLALVVAAAVVQVMAQTAMKPGWRRG